MIKKLLFLVLPLIPAERSFAQSKGYDERIRLLYAATAAHLSDPETGLYFETTDSAHRENLHSWLWPLCALFQAANESDALDASKERLPEAGNAISRYYNAAPPAPGYQDYVSSERKSSRFYDDNQWLAITWLDAWNRLHRKAYLDSAAGIARFMLTGMDTVTGGGLYWKEGDRRTKNTCSNGPAILVLLELFRATHRQGLMDTALQIYRWTNAHLQAPDGIFYDNVKTATGEISKATYTYNTGTMLQANVLLYEITHEKKYLAEAKRIAAAGRLHFFKNGRLPSGNYWFNAVFLRGYAALYAFDRNPDWLNFFREDAEAIWQRERDAENLVGPAAAKRLIDQAAMIEIYARLARLARAGAIADVK